MRDLEIVRPVFSLRDLAVFIAVASLVLALAGPWLRSARERTHRTQCIENLKWIGLGIQNFHDIRQEIPPSYLTDDHTPAALPNDYIAWPYVIRPHLDSYCYPDHDPYVPLTKEPPGGGAGFTHRQARLISIPIYICPTRRQPPAATVDGSCSVGDYACVSIAGLTADPADEPRTWDAAMLPSRTLWVGRIRSMTTFADITDGLSSTAFIGEKAVHRDRLGGNRSNFALTVQAGEQDGTYYYGKGGRLANLAAPGAIAYWSRRLAPEHAGERLLPERPMDEDPRNRFGGWHRGNVTLFLMGDGSVKAIHNDAETIFLQRLGCRNDGGQLGWEE